ncbi:4-hydroxy-3-methylbut-2-en-1-yl diphosphate synthase (flavodoxin) [Vulcanimicrobium alpinum]|uniref:4-hydroxy-3-methylbut-2-en-1-yl diphosphate synthase (flavodoxin) n=1 Tax=Vulcanimicrobium alpinum TaxID=3016050 RepID=A0AAN1XXP9_UNVUL|nr:flavodoxin-dependent (E)-4-hydroxy-3-methylbut-2-enyl-diphosphate synthase [Vulcanimicrobium alpinum]BDE06278.1 4-hydroxy-3-methylbut-2-en-1-yl diphosphate synthase (flavodoxin) [Vulcanimicrobium alpinum]
MIRLRRKTKPILLENKSSWSKDAKKVWIGGDHPIVVQSMTTTDTADADKTLEQVYGLAMAGCEVVRVTCQDARDAAGLPAIVARSPVPIVADVHFDHKMALAALDAGVAKLRLNPGNITSPEKTREVVARALETKTPIRIGVNMGSLARDLEEKLGHTPEALAASALRHVDLLEELGHTDIIISVKAHDALTTIYAYRLLAKQLDERGSPYPLHLGVTEAGLPREGTIKSSIGLGILLFEGIGDTLRVSLAADPIEEVPVAWGILKALGLREKGFDITACPSCGRAEIEVVNLARMVEAIAKEYTAPVKVAVMGCVVNGPGESKMADVGIAGGKGKGAIYRKGELVGTFPENELLGQLRLEIEKVIADQYPDYLHETNREPTPA